MRQSHPHAPRQKARRRPRRRTPLSAARISSFPYRPATSRRRPPPARRRRAAFPDPRERADAPSTSYPTYGVVEIEPDSNGQYQTEMEIDQTPVRALVDTGATLVALTAEDARQLDIDPQPSAFNIPARTANGTAKVAHVRLREISIGDITVHDVDAVVAQPGALRISLLGMSFLRKLSGFQVDAGRFVMKQ
jgi:aspartyl protease family protein